MHNVQDSGFLHYNAVRRPVTCEDWHITHIWKTHALPHHFTKRGGLAPPN